MKIGIWDSGFGGLTILKECLDLVITHGLDIIYFGDLLNSPYGEKDWEFIEKRINYIHKYIIKNGCQLNCIACHTASFVKSFVCNKTSHHTNLELGNLIDTSNEIISILNNNNSNNSTKIFFCTELTHKIIEQFITKKKFISAPIGSHIVKLIHEGKSEEAAIEFLKISQKFISDIQTDNLEIYMGSTHYSIISSKLRELLTIKKINNITIVDPVKRIANYFQNIALNIKNSIITTKLNKDRVLSNKSEVIDIILNTKGDNMQKNISELILSKISSLSNLSSFISESVVMNIDEIKQIENDIYRILDLEKYMRKELIFRVIYI